MWLRPAKPEPLTLLSLKRPKSVGKMLITATDTHTRREIRCSQGPTKDITPTWNEVEASLLLRIVFHLAGQQVEFSWRSVRLVETTVTRKNKLSEQSRNVVFDGIWPLLLLRPKETSDKLLGVRSLCWILTRREFGEKGLHHWLSALHCCTFIIIYII